MQTKTAENVRVREGVWSVCVEGGYLVHRNRAISRKGDDFILVLFGTCRGGGESEGEGGKARRVRVLGTDGGEGEGEGTVCVGLPAPHATTF